MHLQIVIGTKLRRRERFFASWQIPINKGSGRPSIWVGPEIPLLFAYAGNRPPANPLWVAALTASANGGARLTLTPELPDTSTQETFPSSSAAKRFTTGTLMTVTPIRRPGSPLPADGHTSPPCAVAEALILTRVTDQAWQVCDSRHRPDTPGYLLGFVEIVDDGVELMQLGNTFIWTGFPTPQDAFAHIIKITSATAAREASDSRAWFG